MEQLNIACYGSNFDRYDHLYDIVDHLRFANAGVELSMFPDNIEYTRCLKGQRDHFREFPVTFHGPYMEVEATEAQDTPGSLKILQAYQEAFKICRAFSARSIVMHTNQRTVTPYNKEELQRNAVQNITRIARMAEDLQVHLLVENVGEADCGNLLFEEDEFITLFWELPPNVGCLIDIGHAVINDWDLEHVIRVLRKKIKAYHIHNNDGITDIHRPLFEPGRKLSPDDIRRLFACMERETPHSDWILEYAPGPHITRELMISEVTQLLQVLDEIHS